MASAAPIRYNSHREVVGGTVAQRRPGCKGPGPSPFWGTLIRGGEVRVEIGRVRLVNIEEEVPVAYLDYAMSVITARALPDVRDGLKPVQRRILYAMDELGLRSTSPYKKSARIVGEVLGKYHPHGEAPVYEAMVRMAQPFSMRYVLVDGQGNFGSVDGDPPAAMRYTEARLSALAEEMLADIEKNTVDFTPNFDGTLQEPQVLPARLPNLLVNGAAGIAVGMATNIPPHNLGEVVDALTLVIDRLIGGLSAGIPFDLAWARLFHQTVPAETLAAALKTLPATLRARLGPGDAAQRTTALLSLVDQHLEITPDQLLACIKGPDFPTGGVIVGLDGIKQAYTTGHGRVLLRAVAHIEEARGGRSQIVVTELPYQVNKAALLEKIAELVRDRRIEGISDLRDESDRHGMRIVIELKREAVPRQVLTLLYKYTAMQTAFSINMLALVDGQPRALTLKMLLLHYLNHRRQVLARRTAYELEQARRRAHILEGLRRALDHLDQVIALIRAARDAETARSSLMKTLGLSEAQAQAILEMQLRRLAALERQKILDELKETQELVARLERLLADPAELLQLIRQELQTLKEKYADARRTRIVAEVTDDLAEEDLVPDQEVALLVTARGYVKHVPRETLATARRGRGVATALAREDDAVHHLLPTRTRQTVLLLSTRGRAYGLRVQDVPDARSQTRGLPLNNLVSLSAGETVCGLVPLQSTGDLVLVTRQGEVKRIPLAEFQSTRASGANAIALADGDELVWAGLATGEPDLLLVTAQGQAIRFSLADVRPSGRGSGGVRGIRLSDGDQVVAADLAGSTGDLLVVTRRGFGKRVPVSEFSTQGRGGAGVRAVRVTGRNGPVAGARVVPSGADLLLVSQEGLVVRLAVTTVATTSREAQGTPLIDLPAGDTIATLVVLDGQEASAAGTTTPGRTSARRSSPSARRATTTRPARTRRRTDGQS